MSRGLHPAAFQSIMDRLPSKILSPSKRFRTLETDSH